MCGRSRAPRFCGAAGPWWACLRRGCCPETGAMAPATRLNSVVFPAPLGPMIAFTIPCRQEKLTPLMTCRPPNQWCRSRTSRSGPWRAHARRRLEKPEQALRREQHDRHQDRAEHRIIVEPEHAAQGEERERDGDGERPPEASHAAGRNQRHVAHRLHDRRPRPGRCRR